MKHGWAVSVIVGDHWLLVLLVFRRVDRSRGKPFPFGNPGVVQLPRLCNRKEALRHAGAKTFVDDAEVESHGNGRSFVGAGVIKFSVHHDGDGNDASFAFWRKLNQSEGSRPLVNRGFTAVLG